jgi:DNA-binding beta-propeller fold protein YncE
MVSSYGIGVDPSGNIWVANNTATGGVFEIVGAAAPTVTPIALALKNGTIGAKP